MTAATARAASPEELAAEVPPAEAWPRPVNFLAPLAAPPLTADDVPPVLGRFGEAFATAGGFDATGVLSASVVAMAAAVDDAIRIALPGASGHCESARLWVAVVAPPGTGKTPSQKAALGPVYALHRELIEQSQRETEAAGDDSPKPPRRALFTADSTVDKLADVLADNPRGLLYCVDELDSWLGSHDAFARDGGTRNRGEWMRLYDGGPHQIDRVARGSFYVPNWGCSILTATTPAALTRLGKRLSADGLFARFVLFALGRMKATDATASGALVARARSDYDARLRAIHAQPAALVTPPLVRLSPAATELFASERERIAALVEAAEHVGEGFQAHVAKHVAMLARVALVFHAASDELAREDGSIRHPCTAPVSADTMQRAVRFMRKAYRHAWAIHGRTASNGKSLELAQAIARSVLADELADFNRRELTHACRAFRGASEWERLAALRLLEDFGWIEGDTLLPEHGSRWTVNPRVPELFADEAERARARRELVRAALTGDGNE